MPNWCGTPRKCSAPSWISISVPQRSGDAAGLAVLDVAQGRAERPRLCRQLRPRLRHDRAGAARPEWQSPSMITLESALVRKRPSGADRAAVRAALAGHQCSDRLELQHRAGAHDGRRHAVPAPCRRASPLSPSKAPQWRDRAAKQMARALKVNGIDAEPITLKPAQRRRRRNAAQQGRRTRLRSHRQGRLYAKPPAADDFRRHHAAHPRQRQAARADGALIPQLTDLYQTLSPFAYALLRVAVGLALMPHGLRNTFGFFPNTGVRALNLQDLAASSTTAAIGRDDSGRRRSRSRSLSAARCSRSACSRVRSPRPCCCFLLVANVERWRVGKYFWNQLGLEYTLMWTIAAFYVLVQGGGHCRSRSTILIRLAIGQETPVPFIDANGVSLHYELAGARGPSVVLLHELGGTLTSWDAVAPRLAGRYRVLRYDQRGAGLSEKVRQEFTNDMLVDDFEALAAQLSLAAAVSLRHGRRGGDAVAAVSGEASRSGRRARPVQPCAGRRSEPRSGTR